LRHQHSNASCSRLAAPRPTRPAVSAALGGQLGEAAIANDATAAAKLSAAIELAEAEREVLEAELTQLLQFAALDDVKAARGETVHCT
jgi:hypothetical protein